MLGKEIILGEGKVYEPNSGAEKLKARSASRKQMLRSRKMPQRRITGKPSKWNGQPHSRVTERKLEVTQTKISNDIC